MDAVCSYIQDHHYTILGRYKYFPQDENDELHYVGGNISKTSHIIKKLSAINDIIDIIDVNHEVGLVVFNYTKFGRHGSICEVKSNGIHYWLVNLFKM
jgi:hypothetical protein